MHLLTPRTRTCICTRPTAAATRSYLTDANHQNTAHDADFWMDRLQYHLSGGGVGGKLSSGRSADDGSHMLDNKVADENLCLNSMNSQKASLIKRDVS